MQSSRIRTGFHRIGIVLAAIFFVLAVMTAGLAVVKFIDDGWHSASQGLIISMGFLIFAVVAYLAARAIGWIVQGFVSGE